MPFRRPFTLALAGVVAVGTLLGTSVAAAAQPVTTGAPAVQSAIPTAYADPVLGSNVMVFKPTMPTADIQAAFDAVAAQQLDNQFGTARYAMFFEPGTYGTAAEPLIVQVGYYTQVAGLGASPNDVVINGGINVFNQCDADG